MQDTDLYFVHFQYDVTEQERELFLMFDKQNIASAQRVPDERIEKTKKREKMTVVRW